MLVIDDAGETVTLLCECVGCPSRHTLTRADYDAVRAQNAELERGHGIVGADAIRIYCPPCERWRDHGMPAEACTHFGR